MAEEESGVGEQHEQQEQQEQQHGEQQEIYSDADGHDESGQQLSDDSGFSRGKIFIGGLPTETTDFDLKNYFVRFGVLADVVVMKDKITGNGRGFGFVTFEDPQVAEKVVAQRHTIRGRSVEAKLAIPRGEAPGPRSDPSDRVTKIFVGGLASTVSEADFKNYFSRWGKIMDAQIMVDHTTKRSRGFGFITFENYKSVEDVIRIRTHEIKGKPIDIKKAFPKGHFAISSMRGGGGFRGRDDFRDGGRGGSSMFDSRMMQMYQMMMMASGMGGFGDMMRGDRGFRGGGGRGFDRPSWGGMRDEFPPFDMPADGGRDWGDNFSAYPSAAAAPAGGGGMDTAGMDPNSMYLMFQQMYGMGGDGAAAGGAGAAMGGMDNMGGMGMGGMGGGSMDLPYGGGGGGRFHDRDRGGGRDRFHPYGR